MSEKRLREWKRIAAQKGLDDLQVDELLNHLIADCEELNQWIPIENAPKDREILLFYPQDYGGCFQGYWINGRFTCDIEALYDDAPTHYQELPADPKE